MSFNRIRRGPMGGDQYTQLHNYVFRDKRIDPNCKTIFGLVSTHMQGWSTSAAQIAKDLEMSESTVNRALRKLKKFHYLRYGQDRGDDGRVSEGWYFITDLPAQMLAMGVTDDVVVGKAVEDALTAWVEESGRTRAPLTIGPRKKPAEDD